MSARRDVVQCATMRGATEEKRKHDNTILTHVLRRRPFPGLKAWFAAIFAPTPCMEPASQTRLATRFQTARTTGDVASVLSAERRYRRRLRAVAGHVWRDGRSCARVSHTARASCVASADDSAARGGSTAMPRRLVAHYPDAHHPPVGVCLLRGLRACPPLPAARCLAACRAQRPRGRLGPPPLRRAATNRKAPLPPPLRSRVAPSQTLMHLSSSRGT